MSTSEVLEQARITVNAEQGPAFEAAFEEAKLVLASSPGFLGAELRRGIEDPSVYLLLVRWRSLDDHMVNFRGSPLFVRYRQLVGPFFASPPDVSHSQWVSGAEAPGQ